MRPAKKPKRDHHDLRDGTPPVGGYEAPRKRTWLEEVNAELRANHEAAAKKVQKIRDDAAAAKKVQRRRNDAELADLLEQELKRRAAAKRKGDK